MKTLFKVVIVVAMLVTASCVLSAQPRYMIDRHCGTVYFDRMPVYGADPMTFRDLGYGYGKDRYNVYRFGEVLEFVDPATFRVSRRFAVRPGYGKPDRPGYRPGRPGMGHRPPVIIGDDDCCMEDNGYRITTFDVYYRGEKVEDANVHTFQILGYGYAKDAFNVYWRGREIEDASPATFRVLEGGYAKDAFQTYYMGKELDD